MADETDLIEELLCRAGAIMEDAATALALVRDQTIRDRISVAKSAARRIAALGEAAEVLQQIPSG